MHPGVWTRAHDSLTAERWLRFVTNGHVRLLNRLDALVLLVLHCAYARTLPTLRTSRLNLDMRSSANRVGFVRLSATRYKSLRLVGLSPSGRRGILRLGR